MKTLILVLAVIAALSIQADETNEAKKKEIVSEAGKLHLNIDGIGFRIACQFEAGAEGVGFRARSTGRASGFRPLAEILERACRDCSSSGLECKLTGCTAEEMVKSKDGDWEYSGVLYDITGGEQIDTGCPATAKERVPAKSEVTLVERVEAVPQARGRVEPQTGKKSAQKSPRSIETPYYEEHHYEWRGQGPILPEPYDPRFDFPYFRPFYSDDFYGIPQVPHYRRRTR